MSSWFLLYITWTEFKVNGEDVTDDVLKVLLIQTKMENHELSFKGTVLDLSDKPYTCLKAASSNMQPKVRGPSRTLKFITIYKHFEDSI